MGGMGAMWVPAGGGMGAMAACMEGGGGTGAYPGSIRPGCHPGTGHPCGAEGEAGRKLPAPAATFIPAMLGATPPPAPPLFLARGVPPGAGAVFF